MVEGVRTGEIAGQEREIDDLPISEGTEIQASTVLIRVSRRWILFEGISDCGVQRSGIERAACWTRGNS